MLIEFHRDNDADGIEDAQDEETAAIKGLCFGSLRRTLSKFETDPDDESSHQERRGEWGVGKVH